MGEGPRSPRAVTLELLLDIQAGAAGQLCKYRVEGRVPRRHQGKRNLGACIQHVDGI